MPAIKYLPAEILNKLDPLLQKLIFQLEVKEVNYGKDFTEFVYLGKTIRIKVTVK